MTTSADTSEALGPTCPITGEPARAVQSVSTKFVRHLWRLGQGVDVARLFTGVKRLTLYESPSGLMFFDPPIVGDADFYARFYAKWDIHKGLTEEVDRRVDFRRAARSVPEGATVIDIGCGPGLFRRHLPHARFVGLDPYAGPGADEAVIRETLERHAEANPAAYDVATAFHVIEHVSDPLGHARLMAKLLKPGGLLILAAPLHPSPLTDIPNFPLNLPPHHVTWWNAGAFRALVAELGLEVVALETLPVSPHQGVILWLWRLLALRTDPPPNARYVGHRWSWHVSLVLAYALARLAVRFRPVPSGAPDVDAFLVARKPQAA